MPQTIARWHVWHKTIVGQPLINIVVANSTGLYLVEARRASANDPSNAINTRLRNLVQTFPVEGPILHSLLKPKTQTRPKNDPI